MADEVVVNQTSIKADLDSGIPHPEEYGRDPKNMIVTWTNRRKMAWLALWANNILIGLALFVIPEQKIDTLQDIITTFMWVNLSIVAAYLGFTSLPFWGFAKGGNK